MFNKNANIIYLKKFFFFFLQFIKLDMSQLTRDNGVLFSEDLTEDYEVWTMQCPTDVRK